MDSDYKVMEESECLNESNANIKIAETKYEKSRSSKFGLIIEVLII